MDGTFVQSLEAALGALCPSCGNQAAGGFAYQLCPACRGRTPQLGAGVQRLQGVQVCHGGTYQGSLRQLILRAKAGPHSPAWQVLYQRLKRQLLLAEIVPHWITVPPPSWRRRWQGWHLAAELAKRLASDMGCQYQPLLRRAKRRPAQAGLGAHARRRNLAGAFALQAGVHARLPPSLWILDDVWTTGATFQECRRVLEQAGVYVQGALLLAQVENLEDGSAKRGGKLG